MKNLVFAGLLVLGTGNLQAQETFTDRLTEAANGEHRSASNIARNEYRHPVETLSFFGFEDGMTVLEIWPGGGWYTEVIAPAVRGHGQFVIANWDPNVADQPSYRYELPKRLQSKFDANPELYDQVKEVYYTPPESASLGEDNSYDRIYTFRNTHGWVGSGLAEEIFAEFARVLKPGGVLGVVQHRADDDADAMTSARMGYVPQSHVVKLASDAGLVLDAASEVNANSKDTRDHPEGVWTLPPSFELGDTDREKYQAIGESDRMTLRFVKPMQD